MTACNSVLKVSAFKVNHIFQKAKTSHRSPQVHVITKVSADLTQGSRWRLCHQLTRGLGHVLLPHHVSCPLSYTGSRGPAGAPGAPDPLSHSAAAIFLERLRAHAGVCLLRGGSRREGSSLPLAPLCQSWESNLKLTASLCSGPKAFDLPFHSQMPFPPTLMIFTIMVADKALLRCGGSEKDCQRR